jgi:hypothetical protein
MSEEDVQPVIQETHTTLNEDDNLWDTDMAELNAPLGRYREELIPPYPVNDSWVNRDEWLANMYGVFNTKSGYGRRTTSIEEDKVLDVIGGKNGDGVRRMVTTSVLTKDYAM